MHLGLFLLFVGVPLLEIALLIKLGQHIGFWPTIGLIVFTALLGASVLHTQGFRVLARAMEEMSAGRPPIAPVVDGMFLALAGGLLLTPGLITDAAGLLLLAPPIRHFVANFVIRRMLKSDNVRVVVFGTDEDGKPRPGPDPKKAGERRAGDTARPPPGDGPVIDGEFERIDEKTIRRSPPNPDQRDGR